MEKLFSFEGKFPSFRKAGSFCPKRNSLPFERKSLPFRRESIPLPQGNLFPCGRKNIFLRKKIYFCAHENKFPHMRKYFFVYTEINFLIYGNLTPCKPAGNAGSEKGKFGGRKGGFPWAKRGWVSWLRRRSTGAVREGGRRREVGWGAYKKVGSRGDVLLALLPTPFRMPKASLFLLLDDQVDQEEDDDGANSAGQDRSDPAFAE